MPASVRKSEIEKMDFVVIDNYGKYRRDEITRNTRQEQIYDFSVFRFYRF